MNMPGRKNIRRKGVLNYLKQDHKKYLEVMFQSGKLTQGQVDKKIKSAKKQIKVLESKIMTQDSAEGIRTKKRRSKKF
jgi:hypothetical protein